MPFQLQESEMSGNISLEMGFLPHSIWVGIYVECYIIMSKSGENGLHLM